MKSWRTTLWLGFLVWLASFVVGFFACVVRVSSPELFESIMAVAVTLAAVIFGGLHMKKVDTRSSRKGLRLGLIWLLMCILLDAPLFLLGVLTKMTIGEYMADIGLTYVIIPAVTCGLARASHLTLGRERQM